MAGSTTSGRTRSRSSREAEEQGSIELQQRKAVSSPEARDTAAGDDAQILEPMPTRPPSGTASIEDAAPAQQHAIPDTPTFIHAQPAAGHRRQLSSSARSPRARAPATGPTEQESPPPSYHAQHAHAEAGLAGRHSNGSTNSLPLQRAQSHGRDSVLELDLADAALEPMSAAELADPHRQERERLQREARRLKIKRTMSATSARPRRTVRIRAEEAIRAIKERARRDSSSSSSDASDSDGSSSGSSSSSGINWRFWRASSASDTSEDSYVPPETTFTLYTPRLSDKLDSAAPSEHDLVGLGRRSSAVPHPYTSRSAERRDQKPGQQSTGAATPQVFDVLPSKVLAPCLEKLRDFWKERDQEEGIGGDLGASGTATQAQALPARRDMRPSMPTRTNTTASKFRVSPSTLRRTVDTGPAWWLDVQCPTAADMRQIRRLIPLHPLTIEDILAQETREKIESHEALGYYFVAFRALDETYFRYSAVSPSSASTMSASTTMSSTHRGRPNGPFQPGQPANTMGQSKSSSELSEKTGLQHRSTGRNSSEKQRARDDDDNQTLSGKPKKWKVEIVEGAKEGVEGVGVGAVNVYMVVFGDGIITFHFEDIDNHVGKVRDRIQQFGLARSISSHWIAYGLMDSIVDAFFPLIDFLESESDDIEVFLADPMVNQGKRSRTRNLQASLKKRLASNLTVSPSVARWIPRHLQKYIRTSPYMPSAHELEKLNRSTHAPKTMAKKALAGVDAKLYDRSKMLRRIATARKIIVAMSRLLTPKTDVVRGLRKRVRDSAMSAQPGQRHDIGIYLGDLQDHIITMQQTLNFFDTMLSHDHPVYIGILRLAYEAAKIGNDKALVRLYTVVLLAIPITTFISALSINVIVPHNGVWGTPYEEDGVTPAPYNAFGIAIIGVFCVAGLMLAYVYWAHRSARLKYENTRRF